MTKPDFISKFSTRNAIEMTYLKKQNNYKPAYLINEKDGITFNQICSSTKIFSFVILKLAHCARLKLYDFWTTPSLSLFYSFTLSFGNFHEIFRKPKKVVKLNQRNWKFSDWHFQNRDQSFSPKAEPGVRHSSSPMTENTVAFVHR